MGSFITLPFSSSGAVGLPMRVIGPPRNTSRHLPPPSLADEPLLPPTLVLQNGLSLLRRQLGSGLRNRVHRLQPDAGSEVIHAIRVGEFPRTRAPVERIVEPLRAITLRPAFLHR